MMPSAPASSTLEMKWVSRWGTRMTERNSHRLATADEISHCLHAVVSVLHIKEAEVVSCRSKDGRRSRISALTNHHSVNILSCQNSSFLILPKPYFTSSRPAKRGKQKIRILDFVLRIFRSSQESHILKDFFELCFGFGFHPAHRWNSYARFDTDQSERLLDHDGERS